MDSYVFASLALTAIAFTAIWLIHVPLQDAGLVDYYWGPGFAVIGWVGLGFGADLSTSKLVFLGAVTLWSTRLAAQLIARHLKLDGEDGRYAAMRRAGGPGWWWHSLFKVFLLQAFILWAVATPVHTVVAAPAASSFSIAGWIGLSIFATGFLIEAMADWQMHRHRVAVGSGKATFAGGLWAYSRHPNYFGDILVWFGLAIAAYDLSGSLIAFLGPVLLALVIRFVSLPLTEQHLTASRADYAAYAAVTSALVPLLRGGSPRADPAE